MADTASVFPPPTPPSSASTAGSLSVADFNKLATVPTGVIVQGAMVSAEIDFLVTSSDNLLSPTFSGKSFVPVSVKYICTQINGTITTGPTNNIGNNVAKTNITTSAVQPTAAQLNAVNTSGAPGTASTAGGALGFLFVDCATAFKFDITVAAVANTATICKGRVFVTGFWY